MSYSKFFTLLLMILSMLFIMSCVKSPEMLDADKIYEEAMSAMESKKYLQAGELWERLEREHPESDLMSITRLNEAHVFYEMKEYEKAREAYQRFLKLHPLHKEAHTARYRIALCYFSEITTSDRDQTATKQAQEEFQRYLQEYPKGALLDEVKQKLSLTRSRLAEHDLDIAHFYFKKKNYQAARNRLRKIMATYPNIPWIDKVLYLYFQTYYYEGMRDEAQYFSSLLQRKYPESIYIDEVNKIND
ncbi:MAG: outer membrane protein assembly factor BamD [bacterium]